MSNGLRLWDANGVMTLDVSDRLTRVVQNQDCSFAVGVTAVSFAVPGYVNDGTWGFVISKAIARLTISAQTFTLTRLSSTTAEIITVTVFRF